MTCYFEISYHRLKKEETDSDAKETTKVEDNDENEGAEQASGSSWWGMDYSSLLNKAVNTVTTATSNAAELAKQKVGIVKDYFMRSKDYLLELSSNCSQKLSYL